MIAATPNAKTHVATSLISVAIGFGIAPNVTVTTGFLRTAK